MKHRLRIFFTALFSLIFLFSTLGAGFADSAASPKSTQGGVSEKSYTVTLITGDQVLLEIFNDGRQAVTVVPAEREGIQPTYHTRGDGENLYVIPSDVAHYVPEKLDQELFNVTGLVQQGFHDKKTDEIPVMITPVKNTKASEIKVPGLSKVRNFKSVKTVAGSINKKKTKSFGKQLREAKNVNSLSRNNSSDPFAGIEKIWLDQNVEAASDQSVPQTGAPKVWESGYDGSGITVAVLDTGVDDQHPDLKGKVIKSRNFTTSETASDHHGHGTHVAGIIASNGKGDNGKYKGVAPGASILNGKVLGDSGSGQLSWIIAGMEWAAENGAHVINMSLGGNPTDGTDPVSQALNNLTEHYGVLFVVSAGNDGPNKETVGYPGSADAALTVGSVDKSSRLAITSSRGPRINDYAIKPEITAPGVNIVSARAKGTYMGSVVGDHYTQASGTSMASPHVAGAAALMLQKNPNWKPEKLKAALVSTANPASGYTVYQQGAGELDLVRSVNQEVYAQTAALNFGVFKYPHDKATPVTKSVTYANHSNTPVTLSLSLDISHEDGDEIPEEMAQLSANQITIPAKGTAEVDVTINRTLGNYGVYTGYLKATDADEKIVLHTPLGFHKEPEMYSLKVKATARDGKPAGGISFAEVVSVDSLHTTLEGNFDTEGTRVFRVPPGTYSVAGFIYSFDETGLFHQQLAFVSEPEVEVTKDITIELDARRAKRIQVNTTEKNTVAENASMAYFRTTESGAIYYRGVHTLVGLDNELYAAPTKQVSKGEFEYYTGLRLRAPLISMEANGKQKVSLQPRLIFGSSMLEGSYRYPLVYANTGRPEDFAGIDVKGKAVLMKRGPLDFTDQIRNAKEAGAELALIYHDASGYFQGATYYNVIPGYGLSGEQGETLVELLKEGPVTIEGKGTPASPFLYDLIFPEKNKISDSLDYTINPRSVAVIETDYYAHVTGYEMGEVRHRWRPNEMFSVGLLTRLPAPQHRTEYVMAGDTKWRQRVYGSYPLTAAQEEPVTTYKPGEKLNRSWWKQVVRPGIREAIGDFEGQPNYRKEDTLQLWIAEFDDAQPGQWGDRQSGIDQTAFRYYQNDKLIQEANTAKGTFPMDPKRAKYRLELDTARTAPWWTLSTKTYTTWTFYSERPKNDEVEIIPLLLIDYDIDLDLLNRAPKPSERKGPLTINLTVRHQHGAEKIPIEGVRLWTSYDDGESWKEVKNLKSLGKNKFRGITNEQNPKKTSGYVSLKVEARDRDGNRIEQEIIRAYGLTPRN